MAKPNSSDVAISIRLPRTVLKQVDSWADRQQERTTRSDALRYLLDLGLRSVTAARNGQASKKSSERAAGIAGKMIDRLGDKSATAADREHRKRRLLGGPSEFRQMRADHAARRKG